MADILCSPAYLSYLHYFVFNTFDVNADVVLSPSPPAGRLLCRTGIRVHGHEFVIYHHRLVDRRVPERRRTLAAPE